MIILYTFGKAEGEEALEKRFSLEEIGQVFGNEKGPVSREDVRQLMKRGACYLYYNSPDDLAQQYPDLLSQANKKSSEFMVDPIGTTRAIAGAVLTGATYQDLKSKGFSALTLSDPRKILAEYGLCVPRPKGLRNLNSH